MSGRPLTRRSQKASSEKKSAPESLTFIVAKRGFAAPQCGKARLSENSLKIFSRLRLERRRSLQKDLRDLSGKASLTAVGRGKPQRNFLILRGLSKLC